MNALIESALVAALIVAALGLLVIAAAVSDYFTRTEEPRRRSHSDPSTDRWCEDTSHFFHPDGRVSTAVAFARSKNEDRDSAGPRTDKEITLARTRN